MEITPPKRNRSCGVSDTDDKHKKVSSTATSTSHHLDRLRKEVDIFNCPTCLTSRPPDPDASFCTSCGTSLPRLPSPITAQTPKIAESDTCFICGSRLPMNTKKCLVCDSPEGHVKKALIGELDSMDRRLCSACGSLNPARVKFCLTCEALLPFTTANLVNISSLLRNQSKSSTVPSPPASAVNASLSRLEANCRICSRRNPLGVRFCDWCGIQEPCNSDLAKQLQSCAVCPMCFWQTPSDSRFCSQCGFGFAETLKKSPASDLSSRSNTRSSESAGRSVISVASGGSRTAATQTLGLFTPSGLRTKPSGPLGNFSEGSDKPRRATVAPISPGKGLWRMQLEHVVAHFKSYTRNNAIFQKAIGEPRMGKIIYAELDESQPGEVSIYLTFRRHSPSTHVYAFDGVSEASIDLAGDGDRLTSSFPAAVPLSRRQTNNSNVSEVVPSTLAASTPISHLTASDSDNKPSKTVTFSSLTPTFRSSSSNPQPNAEPGHQRLTNLWLDDLLIQQLRPNHKADIHVVERLLKEGANPLCLDPHGDPLVIRAVRSQQLDPILALVKFGADINAVGSRDGNTALHEAVLLGTRSEEFVKLLLRLGGNVKWRNAQGLTPYDLAIHANSLSVAEIIATSEANLRTTDPEV